MADRELKKAKSSSKNVLKKVNSSVKTKKVEEEYDDKWIYILLLSTVVILVESLKNYTFGIGEVDLTYSLFLLPVIYFLTNYITKKKGYKSSVLGISISGIAMVLFVVILNFITGRGFDFSNVVGDFCGYMVSQFVNLTIYQFLLDNTKSNFILIFLTYMFSLIIYYLFYSLFYLNILVVETYWIGYFTTLLLQCLICFILSYMDIQIKRGI